MHDFKTTKLGRSKGYLLAFAIVGLLLVLFLFRNLNDDGKQEFKDFCNDKLSAEFVERPDWLCLRDEEVVYQIGK